MRFSQYTWAFYIIAFPFFLFPRGNPQIADLLGVILVIINFKTIVQSINTNKFTKGLFLFVIYTYFVNSIWMLIVGDILFLKNCITYTYCYLLMMVIFNKINEVGFLNITFKACAISLIIQALLFFVLESQGVRTQMFFNNPNQLALWALCILIITYTTSRILGGKRIYTIPLFLLCSFFVVISASRAALIGVICFWLYYLVKSKKDFAIMCGVVLVSVLILNFAIDLNFKDFATLEYNLDRLSNNTISGNQSIGTRGFKRITENPKYLFLGAGESAHYRFNERIELHSVFANILFSYGLIGLLLYINSFSSLIRKPSLEILAITFVLSLYISVHMSLRLPILWITPLFIIYLHNEKLKSNNLMNTD